MSNNKQFLSDGRRSGKAPAERSNFTQACNLLNQYLKEKGSLRDLNLGMNTKFESIGTNLTPLSSGPFTTVDSVEVLNFPTDLVTGKQETSQATTTIDFLSNMGKEKSSAPLPEYTTVESFLADTDTTNKASSSKSEEAKTAQMTIFYAGQVLVFNNFSAEKARELMLLGLANNGTSAAAEKIDNGNVQFASSSKSVSVFGSNLAPEQPPAALVEANGSDLPIARRASLHKFLAKRKDRATARAPYQVTPKFDLNL